jgi:hypothetical protein
MHRFLYERSIVHKGYLVIPYVAGRLEDKAIYSYALLAAAGHTNPWHQTTNPAGLYAEDGLKILEVAQAHLDEAAVAGGSDDHFQRRYTFLKNLVILYETANKVYYDHYAPTSLVNIAAPKLFAAEQDCIEWIRRGLSHRQVENFVS